MYKKFEIKNIISNFTGQNENIKNINTIWKSKKQKKPAWRTRSSFS